MFCVLFDPQQQLISFEQYQALFSKIQTTQDSGIQINNINPKYNNLNIIIDRLRNNGVYVIHKTENQNGDMQLFCSVELLTKQNLFVGLLYNQANPSTCSIMCKSDTGYLISFTLHALKFLLASDY